MTDEVHYSSKSVEWATPKYLFDWLNQQYHFDLDPCATHKNHTCNRYFTKEDDGMKRDWSFYADAVFMNPPYGNSESICKPNCTKKKCLQRGYHNLTYISGIEDWVKKAYEESVKGIDVVCLIPARTDTVNWWHKYCMKADRIDFVVGRLSFLNYELPSYKEDGNFKVSPASFPSAIVYFLGKSKKGKHPEKPAFNSLYINKKTKEISVK
jgi:phage N-6-adenine-methyltransferase